MTHPPEPAARVRGCMLGGAIGDALGAAVEFDTIDGIRARVGDIGVTDFVPAYGNPAPITDDTQMTLWTAEGLIRARMRGALKGIVHTPSVVDHAYARWLGTQGEESPRWDRRSFDGWLWRVRELRSRRAPGNTCLSALKGVRMGTVDEPLNDSKGCGGVMRIAPAGLLGAAYNGSAFDLGCELAALTHGHPSGYLAAGAMSELTHQICEGREVADALDTVERELAARDRANEVRARLDQARTLAAASEEPGPELVARLGEGWVAEEALAIAVYSALVAQDFEHGVLLAVNHSGDSDSTGAMTGNLLGALLGDLALPRRWAERVEQRDTILALCHDWHAVIAGGGGTMDYEDWWERYPGW